MVDYLPKEKQAKGVRDTGFYQSAKWIKTRDAIKLRDEMTCQFCGEPITGRYVVDHKTEITVDNMHDWDIAYNPANLWLLCQKCHNSKTHGAISTPNTTLW